MPSDKFNILLSAYCCEPFRGTEAGQGWNWAVELARLGHNVFVITRPVGRAGIEALLSRSPIPNLRVIYVDAPHLSVPFGAIRPILAIIEGVRWQNLALLAARKLCEDVPIDLIHHVTWSSLHVGSKLWKLRKPFVFGPVGGGQVAPSGFRHYLKGGRLLELVRSIVVRHLTGLVFSAKSTVSHSTLVLVVNIETEKWVRQLGAPRVEFMLDIGIPQSALVAQEKPHKAAARTLKVLWVGRLVPRKAPLLALEALAKVDKHLNVSCTFLGDGPHGRYLPDWIKRLELNDRVNWRGQVEWKAVMRAYSDHDVLLFTSLRDTGGAQLVEAMASGLPIVTLDHHGATIAVPKEAGMKIPVTTPEQTVLDIARALEQLAKEPETVARMGRAAIQCANSHTYSRKAARISELYPSVIAAFDKDH